MNLHPLTLLSLLSLSLLPTLSLAAPPISPEQRSTFLEKRCLAKNGKAPLLLLPFQQDKEANMCVLK